MHHGRTTIALLFAASLILLFCATPAIAKVGNGSCVTLAGAQPTACYGVRIQPHTGYGAVELCGDCFPCGYKDDVCPLDFGANCNNCLDPDCTATIYGYVLDAGNGQGINDAVVSISPGRHITPFVPVITTVNATTSRNGFYRITDAPRGSYNIRASKSPYAVQYDPITVPVGGLRHDITLGRSPCNADCSRETTEGMVYCDATCQGINGCEFPTMTHNSVTYDARTYCADINYPRTPDEIVPYVASYNATHHINIRCCEGPFGVNRTMTADIRTCAENIYKTEDVGTVIDQNGNTKYRFVKAHYYFYTKGSCLATS